MRTDSSIAKQVAGYGFTPRYQPYGSDGQQWFGWVECQECGKVYEKKQLSRQIRHWLMHQYPGASK